MLETLPGARACALLLLLTTTVRPDPPSAPSGASETPERLTALLESYFRAAAPADRAEIRREIEEAAGGSLDRVAECVRGLQLWSKPIEPEGEVHYQPAPQGDVTVAYRLPSGYVPARAFPLLLCYGDESTSSSDGLALASHVLGPPAAEFVLACPQRPMGGSFHRPPEESGDLPGLLRALRRQVHVDGDRVFLFGYGAGGDAAWTAAIMHADLFAGAVIVSGRPRVPYARQVYPLLLQNLRDLPVLAGWFESREAAPSKELEDVAAHNRGIVGFAASAGLPITGMAMAGAVPPRPTAAFLDEAARLLTHRRPDPPWSVSHWFRYPVQGRSRWLTQTAYKGDVWTEDQLAILPAPASDRDAYIASVVRDRLAYLHGRIDGQDVTIETRRCAAVELSLPAGLFDLNRPVTVRCNGRVRHDGPVRASIETLLETAFAQWEFQRLVPAMVSFSLQSDAERD